MITNLTTAEASRDEFLQLLVTQLRNQDPLEPVKQQDFLSQLAQFSTLEGIEKLNANFDNMLRLQELTQGANLIGRIVSYRTASDTGPAAGVVDAVHVENGNLILTVNGQSVALADVLALAGA